jgi:hypothetical protein
LSRCLCEDLLALEILFRLLGYRVEQRDEEVERMNREFKVRSVLK